MIKYEVNLEINQEVYEEFVEWLSNHIKEVLEFEGFKKAKIFEEEKDETNKDFQKITVCYDLVSRSSLQDYFDHHASRMRQQTANKFGDRVKAFRRIFELKNVIEK